MDIIQEAKAILTLKKETEALSNDADINITATHLKDLFRVIDGLVDRLEWKSIESAPKDWSSVILYTPYTDNNTETFEGYYSCEDGGDDCWKVANTNLATNPTHWMPLPLPPVGDK